MSLGLALGFDTLKADAALLSALIASLESTLAATLRTAVKQQLLMTAAASGNIAKISRAATSSQNAVTVDISLTVPAGVTEGQVEGLMRLVVGDTAGLFSGSPYVSYLTGPASVSFVSSGGDDSLSAGAVVGVAIAACAGTLLLIGACYGIYRWRLFAAIVPKKPQGDWDPTGVAVVSRKAGLRRRGPRGGQPSAEGEGDVPGSAGVLPAEGPAGSSAAPPQAPMAVGGGKVAPWADGGGGPAAGGAGAGAAGGGGGGGVGLKSEAALPPSREAWM